jgi:hypothetical protein
MGQDITASYVWTAEELIKARENHWRAQCRPICRGGIVFLSLMAILGGWAFYQHDGWGIPAILLPLAGVYFLFLRKYDVRWGIRRHFAKRPDKGLQIVWTFADDGARTWTAEAESRRNWSQISKVRKARDGFLLYPNDTMFHWLPFTALASDQDRAHLEELLRTKVPDFAEVR